MRSQALDRISRRIGWVRFGGLALVMVLAGRAAHLTIVRTRAMDLYDRQIQTERTIAAARGTIFDREGRELAVTTEAASIFAQPHRIRDRDAVAKGLATALGLELAHVQKRLAAHDRFTYIARWVDSKKADRVRALDLPGVGIDLEPRRSYPAGKLAAPLIGFANIDGQGVRAIEQVENQWLQGRPHSIRVERDARGRALALRATNPREAQGGDIALALDAAMQGAAEAALHAAVDKTHALGGVVITLDPKTGDVLALAEAPGFDPNRFRELDFAQTRARSFSDLVEAGSTMKAFLVAAALDAGRIDDHFEFDTGEGSMRVPGKTIRDHEAYGVLRPADILRVSSNIGAVQIAQLLGREAHYKGLLRFGFGSSTRSGFPMEARGLVRDWAKWKPVDHATIAFGQGISVTAIQLASALATLANDGERMQPRIVLARRKNGEPWTQTAIHSHGQAVSPDAARRTLDMMRSVVSASGTGRLAALAGVPVAGKTGTAQKLDIEAGRYSKNRYIAWFMGVVPADDPELAIIVAIDEPQGHLHSGGYIAAPVFARVAAAQLARRGIITEPAPIAKAIPTLLVQPTRDRDNAKSENEFAKNETSDEYETNVPKDDEGRDLRRSTRADALDALAVAETQIAIAPNTHDRPRLAAVATPPTRPAAHGAAGLSVSLFAGPAFVPDFSGQTMARARFVAAGESLLITTLGAIEGRVVSQLPVPGTLLEGKDRTVRLRFAALREEG